MEVTHNYWASSSDKSMGDFSPLEFPNYLYRYNEIIIKCI